MMVAQALFWRNPMMASGLDKQSVVVSEQPVAQEKGVVIKA